MPNSDVLSVKGLSFSYENGPLILNNIHFKVQQSEILAIIGESGCGKTTLLRIIGGFEYFTNGQILISGQKHFKASEKLIDGNDHVKWVNQDSVLFPNVSIRENIAYELRLHPEAYMTKRTQQLLKVAGLLHVADRLPRQVSGGERQRATIARAVAEKPKLLLMDEPFSHLDATNKSRLKSMLKKLADQDATSLIFVTHDMADALSFSHHVLVMKNGKVIQNGTPKQIYSKPTSLYVASLTGKINVVNIDSRRYLLRPENIKMGSMYTNFMVQHCDYLGREYLITAQKDNEVIQFYHPEPLEFGVNISLDFFV